MDKFDEGFSLTNPRFCLGLIMMFYTIVFCYWIILFRLYCSNFSIQCILFEMLNIMFNICFYRIWFNDKFFCFLSS